MDDAHKIPLEELFQRVGSSPEGLTLSESLARLKQFGFNRFEERARTPLVVLFGKHLINPFAILLWIGSFLAFFSEFFSPGTGDIYIGIALIVVIFINGFFSFYQEYQSEKIIESFHNMMPPLIDVLRDKKEITISASHIVPGDIVFLKEGNKIPADGRLLSENELKVDHSSLTGESEPQLRSLKCTHPNVLHSRNMIFAGTLVQSGDGVAVIYQTGMQTHIGKIAALTKTTHQGISPLKKELNRFIRIISFISVVLGLVFLSIGLSIGDNILSSLIFSIGILVANIPEGLLPTATLCLRIAAKRMAKRKALIKRLESVETLGSTTVICTDKTGTITENKTIANTLFINFQEIIIDGEKLDQVPGVSDLLKICILCNNAHPSKSKRVTGDPVDTALLAFSDRHTQSAEVIQNHPRLREHPFDRIQRKMITINREGNRKAAHLKGAPEVVIESCNRILINGGIEALTEDRKKQLLSAYDSLASRGERVMGFAFATEDPFKEKEFVFVALMGLTDPPKKDVHEAISKCLKAGIKVIMITGDSTKTAEAIGKKVGLLTSSTALTISGEKLDLATDEEVKCLLSRPQIVFSRTTPLQKLRIVKLLQSMGEIVTVTGDGVNDAPALKQADMGVAMGIMGTEVAKEAADMVLLDDHFGSIVNAIEEGRTLFGNIRKFISYVLTHLIPEVLPFIAFVLLQIPLPLTIALILLIDLGTEILPALGIGTETPEEDVMNRPPRPRTEHLLTRPLLIRSYCIIGIIEALAGFFSYFVVLLSHGWEWGQELASQSPLYQKATTAFFVSIVICQIANVLVCRTERESIFKKGIFSNHFILFGIAVEVMIIWFVTSNPLANTFFGTQPLTLFEFALPLPFAFLIFFWEELRKSRLREKPKNP